MFTKQDAHNSHFVSRQTRHRWEDNIKMYLTLGARLWAGFV